MEENERKAMRTKPRRRRIKPSDQAQLDAEARDRNPKVKQLVDRAMELMNPKESEDGNAGENFVITKEMYDEYLDLCNKALAMEPEYYQLHFQVAIVYLRLGKISKSIETIQNALKYGQNFPHRALASRQLLRVARGSKHR